MAIKMENKNGQPSPLTLAFVGDGVYTLLVRSYLVRQANRPAGQLHKLSVDMVNAAAQARAMETIMPLLTEKELSAFKRGRNAHPSHSSKCSSDRDYHYATGFEAVFGYLYLMDDFDRINFLFSKICESESGKNNSNNVLE